MNDPKVALVHEYLNQYGGAEKTLEKIMELFPKAPIYTGLYSPKEVSDKIRQRDIRGTKNILLNKFTKIFTVIMPLIFENINLDEYDLIISDGTAWSKCVLTRPHQLHISYVHTPPRFLYKYSVESAKRDAWYFKPVVPFIDFLLRIWDYYAAQRPDYLIANSIEVKNRIQKFYKRDSVVIYPPVQTIYKTKDIPEINSAFYLAIGRLSAYKNFDLLVQAFNLLELPLYIIGGGKEEKKLKALAKNNITFLGKLDEGSKHAYLDKCLGLINPVQDEDFGIVPVEAMAHGKPVLGHKSGGTMETILDGKTGRFFTDLNVAHLAQKIRDFDAEVRKNKFDTKVLKKHAEMFGEARFEKELKAFIEQKWVEKNAHSL